MLSEASHRAGLALPGRLATCSDALGWQDVLARSYRWPAHAEEFTTAPSSDLMVVVQLTGSYTLESKRGPGWERATYVPGTVGVTAPGLGTTLRSRGWVGTPAQTLQIHVAAPLLRETAEALGDGRAVERLPNDLVLADPVVLAIGQALGVALRQRAVALAADGLAQAMAAHFLGRPPVAVRDIRARRTLALGDRDLTQVLEHMHANIAETVRLHELADLVNVSKFHFLRMFKETTGTTPQKYLTRLRMERAASLLRGTRWTVAEVSAACGYSSPGHFAEAFRRRHGTSPREYRRVEQG